MTQSHTSTDIYTLIEQGKSALDAYNILDAQKYFRRATELDTDNVEAWLGMTASVRSYRDKQRYLQRILAIDPAHAEASATLAEVERKLAEGAVLAPPLRPPEPPPDPEVASSPLIEATPAVTELPAAEPVSGANGHDSHTHDAEVEIGVCYRHPDRETGLRCIQCGRYICTECVRPAFVGQLCPECAQVRRPTNYKVSPQSLLVAGAITLVLSAILSWLAVSFLGIMGFFSLIIAFLIAPFAAEMILRILDRATHNKRGREMQLIVGISYAVGAGFWLVPLLLIGFIPFAALLFTGIAIATLVARLR